MGQAGYLGSVKKTGTSTSFSGESMSNTAGNTWQIDDATKEIFDRNTVPDFFDNGVPIVAGDILSIDNLYGKVTFTSSKSGPITVSGDYLPSTEVAGAKSVEWTRTAQIHDDTDTANLGYHTKVYGKLSISITLGRWDDIQYAFVTAMETRLPFVIEIAPSSGKSYRIWVVPETSGLTLSVDALLEESITFQSAGSTTVGNTFSRSNA